MNSNRILATSVASLVALCTIGRPVPAFGDDNEGRPASEDKPDTQLGLHDKVAGEEAPDFSFITGDDSAPASSAAAPPAAPAPNPAPSQPEKATEPPAGTPARPKVVDPNDELEIPSVKPAKEVGEQPMPDPKEAAEKAAADKKAADDQAVADKAAADKKAADDKAAADAGKQPEVKLPTEEELEAMQPKPGAPAKVVADFKKLKEEVVKPALNEVKRLKAENETLRTQTERAITPEVEQKLKQAEEDRTWRMAHELQNDPVLQQELREGRERVETDLYATLGRYGLSEASIEELKKVGLDSEKGREYRKNVLERAQKALDPLAFDEVKDGFKAVDAQAKAQQARLDGLKGSQETLLAAKEERDKAERVGWATAADENIVNLVKDDQRFLLKEAPATATAEEKAAIEAHNKELQEVIVPAMHEGIRAIHGRDPEKTMKYLVDSIRLQRVEAELTQRKAEFEQKIAEAEARIKELEGDAGRMRRVTSPSRVDNAPPAETKTSGSVDTSMMTAEQAADAYAREKNIGQGYRV